MKQQYLTSNIEFPIPYMHDGIMFGCGGIGLWLWGSGRDLQLTVGLGDLWDHRGGLHWTEKQNFKAIRAALEKKDADALSAIFPPKEGEPARPTLLPFGRISMRLPAGWKLRQCSLDLQTGIPEVLAVCGTRTAVIRFAASLAHGRNFGCTGLPAGTDVTLIPSWHLTRKMAERGIAAPAEYADTEQLYFCQPLPADPAAVLKICKKRSGFSAVCLRGMEDGNAILAVPTPSFARLRTASVQWWRNYWSNVPELQMPEENLMKLYSGGLFRYGILTDPDGVAPGLQGAWIEDDGLPPWEGDYHFNINVQMCISPGFCAGKYHHLKPMFDLVLSWKDQLRRNAQYFAGVEGYMLPHAVDDRCTCMGNFWSGAVDHGCTAWMAHLMYRYCQYCNDKDFLRDEVEDFMLGTLRVFRAMMDREPDGTLSLPISVSPE
ncbi:MAG: hypothetical protein J6R85_05120, partial [Lentisphaeria bacterium]|nr:hypothetical protein [Lentisphaeria bacterium]